ncbi:hypothetical protein SMD44_08789 [Streptomyces alboflavus]|uniref:Uncharacterized protein n=1 Tax=Streptomyces alboflavus TaxID=67267 RepID=A0A1Z1WSK4_9ACTN|nr:hypothetical protein SMD44_08789 [Streptomyces alboflavus]
MSAGSRVVATATTSVTAPAIVSQACQSNHVDSTPPANDRPRRPTGMNVPQMASADVSRLPLPRPNSRTGATITTIT